PPPRSSIGLECGSNRRSFVICVFFACSMRLCGVVGGLDRTAPHGKECRKVFQELGTVRMFHRQRCFSDSESSFVIFLGIRMQTLASVKAAKAVQTERNVRILRGKLGFTDL